MPLKKLLLTLTGFFLSLYATISHGSPLKEDETVLFFPVSAIQDSTGSWSVPIHHWVFEKEEDAIGRKITQKLFSEVFERLGVSEEQAESPLTKQRLMWFLVDNQRNKRINISINGKRQKLDVTGPNGHALTTVKIGTVDVKVGDWICFKVEDESKRKFTGQAQLIPETGVSVISDIDDTIKVSNVLDKKELIKNTFVNPYLVTDGFPEYYKKLQADGAYFHYVSASPWQLYPSLKPFMKEHYPKGTISLRKFRLKDSSLISFLKPSVVYKTKQITKIINRYPKHQFILIGDSGEHDPQVYADIYKLFPSKIKSIQIRAVEGSDLSDGRFSTTFKQVPESVWQLISNPLEKI